MRSSSLFPFLLVVLLTCWTTVSAQETIELSQAKSFVFALGLNNEDVASELEKLRAHDLIIVDGEEVSAENISLLKQNGSIVLGYVSVGTIETGRSWYHKVKKFRLDLWGDWGEWYARVSKKKFRRILIKQAVKPFLQKGFDGLFLDNVDMVAEYPKQTKGMRKLVKRIAKLVHDENKYVGAQNGDDVIGPFVPYLDHWNREDVVSTYNFDTEVYEQVSERDTQSALETVSHLLETGLFVTTTDYVADVGGEIAQSAVSTACGAGAVPYVGDIELTEITESPLLCE
ncbi:MAG: endo alpha-1,4 polygalactosaminidase [Bdellovibrionales bacterium]|nr:endo alpha-1,4 polygalactosaminidase [Bdellovibrionales bacterium]